MVKKVIAVVLAVAMAAAVFAAPATVLKVAHFYDPMVESAKTSVDWFADIIKQFEAANPGVKVETEVFQWDQIDVKSMSDFRAGVKDHDVMLSSPQLMAQHGLVGDLADLSAYVKRDFSKAELAEFNWASIWDKGDVNGKKLGIPLGVHTRALVYNKEMFVKAGLDPNKPPKTLQELVDMAQKVQKSARDGGQSDVYGLGMYFGPSRATIELFFAPLIWEFGGDIWDAKTKKASFASASGVKAAQFCKDLIKKYKVTPETVVTGTYDSAIRDAFVNGEIGIAWGMGSYWINILEEKGFAKGVFPPSPEGRADKVGIALLPFTKGATFNNSWDVSVYSKSEHKDLAWKFIQTMIKAQNIIGYPDAGLPIRASLWDTPAMKTPFYKAWKQSVSTGRPMPPTAHYGELADTVAAALQQILVQDGDIADTLKKAQDNYNAQYGGE
jgi:multiple sugar transport system substrate-binding protein